MKTYKLHLPKYTIYYSDSESSNRTTWLDYWTSVKAKDDATDSEIIRLGKENLIKQIAQSELFNIKLYKTIGLENRDIRVVRS